MTHLVYKGVLVSNDSALGRTIKAKPKLAALHNVWEAECKAIFDATTADYDRIFSAEDRLWFAKAAKDLRLVSGERPCASTS